MLLTAEAPAKINRELRVGRRRADGFHEIRSRLVSIELADRLEVEPAGSLEFSSSGLPAPRDETNLVVRAARALAEHAGVAPLARIHLEKRVPAGAGLGGGSADAAVALLLLAKLWGAGVKVEDLSRIAASLGSDVPFFLVGGQAQVEGRGERLRPMDDAPPTELLLLIPPFSISTRAVYDAYARQGRAPDLPERLEIEDSARFFGPNDLASAVLETQSGMEIYMRAAAEAAPESAISGSGSALVLLGATDAARRELARSHPEAALLSTRTLGRQEYRQRTSSTSRGGAAWKSPR